MRLLIIVLTMWSATANAAILRLSGDISQDIQFERTAVDFGELTGKYAQTQRGIGVTHITMDEMYDFGFGAGRFENGLIMDIAGVDCVFNDPTQCGALFNTFIFVHGFRLEGSSWTTAQGLSGAWQIIETPLPGAVWLFIVGLGVLTGTQRHRSP